MQDVDVEMNRITGTLDISEARILLLQIPYSKGWSCRVDGKETEIMRGDTAFMAVKLEPGQHKIEFTYRTPYIIICSIVSMISTLFFVIWYNIKKQRRGNHNTYVDI